MVREIRQIEQKAGQGDMEDYKRYQSLLSGLGVLDRDVTRDRNTLQRLSTSLMFCREYSLKLKDELQKAEQIVLERSQQAPVTGAAATH